MAKAKVKRLVDYRRELKAAERALLKTRDALRGAVKQRGLSTAGIFSETKFVERETAERWRSEASDKAAAQIIGVITRMREQAEKGGPASPFAFLTTPATAAATPAIPPGKPPFLIVNNTTTTAEVVDDAAPAIIQESTRILKP
jgi:hypothetical protein